MNKDNIVNNLYQASVISGLAIGYTMICKKFLKIDAPKFDKLSMEGVGKIVLIVAGSDITRDYLVKQKILPEKIFI